MLQNIRSLRPLTPTLQGTASRQKAASDRTDHKKLMYDRKAALHCYLAFIPTLHGWPLLVQSQFCATKHQNWAKSSGKEICRQLFTQKISGRFSSIFNSEEIINAAENVEQNWKQRLKEKVTDIVQVCNRKSANESIFLSPKQPEWEK